MVQDYVRRVKGVEPCMIEDAVEWYLKECARRDLRENTFLGYQYSVSRMARAFSGMRMTDVTGEALLDWLMDLPVNALSKRNYCRDVNAFFEACRRRERPFVAENPANGLRDKLPKVRRRSRVGFLSVDELRRFLSAAESEYKGMFAVLAFTGIRLTEGRRIKGDCVRVERKLIDVPEGMSKTDRPRLIEGAPACLWAWLERFPLRLGRPIVPERGKYRTILERTRKRAEIKAWSANAFRHGFASYFYAATDRNIGLTMEIMGHKGNQRLFHAGHYKGKATKAEGQAFCELWP